MGYLLDHLLSESAQRSPSAVAVRFGEATVDYGTLEALGNRAARALREEGVGAGDRVGLHMKKTPKALAALFGILKAGACAVPIHPATPPARVGDIVEQCAMRQLIGSAEACAQLAAPAFEPGGLERLLVVDAPAEPAGTCSPGWIDLTAAMDAQEPEPLPVAATDTDLAYVLFTSGSTGSPKGVMLSHRAVLSFVRWAGDEFAISPDDRLANHAPLNFDLSTFDIYAAVRAGAAVTVIPDGMSAFPVRLGELIERDAITVWYSVPSVLSALLARGGLERRRLDALRLVLFAGEVFPVARLRQLMLTVPGPRYFNLYGPTETNVCAYYEVQTPPAPDAVAIPIGRACANTRTLVLDEDGAPVEAPGQEGVLHVAGSTLSDGYWGRAAETRAAFRARPLPGGRTELLYCTGDWVTTDEDGNHLFLGRRDQMVKVGGHRVELGEIEAALHSHPAVTAAVAVPLPDEALGTRITAVVAASSDLDARALKRHCVGLLPRYMVPQRIAFRESLPRTATDKVDRPRVLAELLAGASHAG